MDIEINEVQEIIKNLEGGGGLSIKEEKYLKIAKLCVQLAAENVALKRVPETDSGAMLLALYSFRSESLPDVGLQKAFESLMHHRKTTATDRFVAGIKADGVEMFVEKCREKSMLAISSDIRNNWWLAGEHADDFAKQLREGANHD